MALRGCLRKERAAALRPGRLFDSNLSCGAQSWPPKSARREARAQCIRAVSTAKTKTRQWEAPATAVGIRLVHLHHRKSCGPPLSSPVSFRPLPNGEDGPREQPDQGDRQEI